MSWLTPLGFLGLAGLIALIIIYIIKPNYQLKIISSTYIWKLSLKLRKKKIPINKLRNILIFICQMLIITATSLMLAQPFIEAEKEDKIVEKIAVIDASASMLSSMGAETRFERAVEDVRTLATETIGEGGKISIILAAEKADYIVQDATKENGGLVNVYAALDALIDPSASGICTYGESDIEGAMKLADQVTSKKSGVEVRLYTDTTYIDKGNVKVIDVSDPLEWNAAILDTRATVHENYYRIEIDIASYGGKDSDIRVFCDVNNVNGGETPLNLVANARCKSDEITTLVFGNYDKEFNPDDTIIEDVEILSFESISVYIQEKDSFEYDNSFYLYGGKKQPLNVQYYSAMPNSYFSSALMVMENQLSSIWDVTVTEVKADQTPAYEGYDLYIFEHVVPTTIPSDGIVFFANPNSMSIETGLRLGQTKASQSAISLQASDEHPLIKGLDPSRIELTKYTEIASYDGYTSLLEYNGVPLVMVKDEPYQKYVVMSFSLNYSNFSMMPDFPMFINNIFNYFLPPTVTDFVFSVNDSVTLNSRSEKLSVVGPSLNTSISTFPGTVELKTPGVYTVSQIPISGVEIVENFYVKIPATESNIGLVVDTLDAPFFMPTEEIENQDLLMYFALAMVALLFCEWWLHSREQF